MLTSLFGRHNLTSEAETEEMLAVSRRKVIAAYSYSKKKFNDEIKNGIEDISLDRLAGIMFAIEHLFGSACLSEKVASKPKFKVGDKVKILSNGQTGYIMSIDKNLYHIVYNNFAEVLGGVFTDYEIEPYTGQQSKHEENRNESDADKPLESYTEQELLPKTDSDKRPTNVKNYDNKMIRLQVATAAMQGILCNPNVIMSCGGMEDNQEYITKYAVMYADALLAEINRKGD